MKKTPVTILAGFLGAGKTTLLNRILNAEHGMRVAVLVNDFGEINIDSQLIASVEGEKISLANGCVCCTIRDDLVSAILDLLTGPEAPDYIITETSGVSDPAEVAMGFALSSKLALRVELDAIVTIVDAENVLTLDEVPRNLAVDQIAAADIVIVNKVDLVDVEAVETLHTWIRKIAPQARVCDARYSDVPLDVLLSIGAHSPERLVERIGEHPLDSHDHGDRFVTWSWTSDQALVFQAVYQAFKTLPLDVFRAKGILNLQEVADKRSIVHMVGKRVTIEKGEPWARSQPTSQIVAIAAGDWIDGAEMTARFDACIATGGHDPGSHNPLTEAVVQFLRRPAGSRD